MKNSVILFFIDGLGIGERKSINPLYTTESIEPLAVFKDGNNHKSFGGSVVPTDATLGIEGRPQSASGQTTILTGINAPGFLGHHKQGFPNEKLRNVIKENSIFLQLKNKQIEPNIFINTYTPKFFETTPRWKSATTCAVEAAELRFCKLPDLLGRKSLFHDFTNRHLIELGYDVPIFTAVEAAEILSAAAAKYRFVLYEHFITDKIGHKQDFVWAEKHLPELAEFIRETIKRLDLSRTTFILISDHGNIEDLSIKTHTLNKIPTIIWGRNDREIAGQIKNLTDITPAILNLLSL